MSDWNRIQAIVGDADAVSMLQSITLIADVWDNLIDGDPESHQRINAMMWKALIDLPGNRFYREHEQTLRPILANSILSWFTANELESGSQEDRCIAHVMRYAIGDVLQMCVLITQGQQAAQAHGAELRRMAQRDTLSNFLEECNEKHKSPTTV